MTTELEEVEDACGRLQHLRNQIALASAELEQVAMACEVLDKNSADDQVVNLSYCYGDNRSDAVIVKLPKSLVKDKLERTKLDLIPRLKDLLDNVPKSVFDPDNKL